MKPVSKRGALLSEDSPVGDRTCGRPTRSGKPCRVRIYGRAVACSLHITEHEREIAEAYQRGYREGRESSDAASRSNVERLEGRVRELEQRLDEASRLFEIDGDQIVQVGKLTYRWRGPEPLAVGDRVLLPENWLSRMKDGPGPYEGVVTELGSSYRGELSFIVRRLGQDTTG
jgi:hypothetical protein